MSLSQTACVTRSAVKPKVIKDKPKPEWLRIIERPEVTEEDIYCSDIANWVVMQGAWLDEYEANIRSLQDFYTDTDTDK